MGEESTVRSSEDDSLFYPIFSFADSPSEMVEKFDRIDDVIMGGISSSVLMPVDDDATGPGHSYAKWFGNIRVDGGGFCGIRTLPFVDALNVTTKLGSTADAAVAAVAGGFYVTCRLASDNEPERRVWKMSTRVRPDRGEQLYQARFHLPRKDINQSSSWDVIQVPFDDFKLVRGPLVKWSLVDQP
jgi:Complex I intermediate-associated protein 30 (CIA30)